MSTKKDQGVSYYPNTPCMQDLPTLTPETTPPKKGKGIPNKFSWNHPGISWNDRVSRRFAVSLSPDLHRWMPATTGEWRSTRPPLARRSGASMNDVACSEGCTVRVTSGRGGLEKSPTFYTLGITRFPWRMMGPDCRPATISVK